MMSKTSQSNEIKATLCALDLMTERNHIGLQPNYRHTPPTTMRLPFQRKLTQWRGHKDVTSSSF